jgi:SAM-dependent methyltransferase
MLDLVLKFTNKNMSAIDIGGREGFFLSRLKEKGYNDLYCIDISKEAIDFLKKRGLKGHVANIQENLEVDRTFDIAIISHVLEHCPDPSKIINLIFNILNENGIQFIEVPNEPFKEFPTKYGHYYGFYSYDDIINFEKEIILEEGCSFLIPANKIHSVRAGNKQWDMIVKFQNIK